MESHTPLLTSATIENIPLIQSIARTTWPTTFGNILTKEQISYMLDMMYHTGTLKQQILNPNYHYYLINKDAGFAALELHYEGTSISKIHKLYIRPVHQGKGLGYQTIVQLETISRFAGDKAHILNVNKTNPATRFYEKSGFHRWKSEVIDIGNGYVMDDYVYRKTF